MKHTIAVYDPGHFHAALLFSKPSPRAGPVIHVYAPPGRDAEDFSDLINRFNCRDIDLTNWRLERHIGGDALEALIAERPGEIVTLAGKNTCACRSCTACTTKGSMFWPTSPG